MRQEDTKQAIFEAIVASTAERYQRDTDKIQIHVEDNRRDASAFVHITEEALFQKVRQIFEYSLHDDVIRRFRKMRKVNRILKLRKQKNRPQTADFLYSHVVLTMIWQQ